MNLLKILCAMLVFLLVGPLHAQNSHLLAEPKVQHFIDKMVQAHGFAKQDLENLFSQVQIQPKIIATMKAPHEAKPWYIYRKTFLSPARIEAGRKYWQNHAIILDNVEKEYGIPAHIIVAIIGVETFYGKQKGSHRVMDALSTLAFYYPSRAQFFTDELEQFLLLCREQRWDPFAILGSYAGAMGKPQFMPSSYRKYAVSYYKDGHIDLMDRDGDVIASVANYFKQHGWQSDQTRIVERKQIPFAFIPTSGRAAFEFVRLEGEEGPEFWLGWPNFYVLSRYNPRINYTMAVYQLSEMIRTLPRG